MTKFPLITRSHLPHHSRRPALALIAGAALVAAGLASATGASAAPADAASSEWSTTWTQSMLAFEPLQEVKKHLCPVGMRLSDHDYHPYWVVPTGLEITQGVHNAFFDADIRSHAADGLFGGPAVGVGGFGSTVSNWFGAAQTVTFVMHCVR